MIPNVGINLSEVEIQTMPSLDHRMYLDNQRIYGKCDKLTVMTQVVYKILNTDRYRYLIYSWNYGIELDDLFGKHKLWVTSELERRITEALTQDDRITSVDGFEFDTSKRGEVVAKFTVHTIFGDVVAEKGVEF